jgi:hypothetical protein
MRLNFAKLREKIVINREGEKVKYFNKDDIKFFNSDVKKIEGVQLYNQLIFIKDNCKFNNEHSIDFKIKVYDLKNNKISTCLISKDEILIDNVLNSVNYMRCFTDEEIEVIMTGDIIFKNNSINIYSSYFKKGIVLL